MHVDRSDGLEVNRLRAQQQRTRMTPEEEQEGAEKEDVAVFPLAIPLLAGPGSIATVTALMGKAGRILYAVPVVLSRARRQHSAQRRALDDRE